jgi:excinuclease ABC subunit B
MSIFKLESSYKPNGDQPQAIKSLVEGISDGLAAQTLLGVTGSGKTFTMAHVIAQCQRPTLILAHNKTLAGQLYNEFKKLFPHNAVSYFVSYYDYYQPEAYLPSTDTFIEKDSRVNEEIERLRHAATQSLLERKDVIIVASVSCIYGLGSPQSYQAQQLRLRVDHEYDRDEAMARLVEIQYARNDIDFHQGCFRVKGDLLDIFPIHSESQAIRVSFFGDEVEEIHSFDPLRGKIIERLDAITIYPASHYVAPEERLREAISSIRVELDERLNEFLVQHKLLEAQRLQQRTEHDLELLSQVGFCKGIENYSRHLTGAQPGDAPPCLLDYFGDEWLLFIDESHVTLPQVRGMYKGDRSRKLSLVEHGFRLPSALDNRPQNFDEFNTKVQQVIYVSATPSAYEIETSEGVIVEQLIRPTGLLDPLVEVRPALNQVDDLLIEIRKVIQQGFRILVTTLTKRMSEELTDYYAEIGLQVRYLHSEIDTIARSALLRDLRKGEFDVLIGINLLREGLDLPEVGLVAILDADKEGFLRNRSSLIQTMGRAARNVEGRVLLYADRNTASIQAAIEETTRRREIQHEYNQKYSIIPQTVIKEIYDLGIVDVNTEDLNISADNQWSSILNMDDLQKQIEHIRKAMMEEAQALRFEEAAQLRDELKALETMALQIE